MLYLCMMFSTKRLYGTLFIDMKISAMFLSSTTNASLSVEVILGETYMTFVDPSFADDTCYLCSI